MPVKLNSSGGGSVTIDVPSTASSYTLTAPAATATLAIQGPAFFAYVPVGSPPYTQFSNSTATKIPLSVEYFDTANCFDSTTNYRFTPNVAGYYQINAQIESNWYTTQFQFFKASIYKNGTEYSRGQINSSSSIYNFSTCITSTVVYLNGSTDYVELYAYSSGGSGPLYDHGAVATSMSGFLARAA